MRNLDLNQEPQLNLQSQYNTVLRIASTAILEILLQQPADDEKVAALADVLRNAGKTSVPVSILLVINMLDDLKNISPNLEDILKKVLAHHSFEVVSDNLPPALANIFNSLAIKVCDNPVAIENLQHESELALLQKMLGGAEVNIGQRMLVIDALKANLVAIAELISACESADPVIYNYIKDALKSRYVGVSLINNGLYQNPESTFAQVLAARSDSIMIKVTQMCFIAGMCVDNENVRSYVLSNFEAVTQVVDNAALLIGMWNDCGSETLTLKNSEVDPEFILKCLDESSIKSFRELIAERLKDSTDEDTQQLIQKVSGIDSDATRPDLQWKYLTQPVKDAAKAEPNILLDFGNIENTLDLLRKANQYSIKIVETFLKDSNVPAALKRVIAGAVYQHEILYGGRGDYYDERESDFLSNLYTLTQTSIRQAIQRKIA